LKNNDEWRQYCKGELPNLTKLPEDIPATPERTYHRRWAGWGDWLGTGAVSNRLREFRSFEEARAFSRGLKLKSGTTWRKYCKGNLPGQVKLPQDIPTHPDRTYKSQGWKGMGDWLGTGTVAPRLRKYRLFTEARAFAHGLKLKSRNEWSRYCKAEVPNLTKLPEDIPAKPDNTYKNLGWKGTRDWLGTTNVEDKTKMPTIVSPLSAPPTSD